MSEPLIRELESPFGRFAGHPHRHPDLQAAALVCMRWIAVWFNRHRQRRVLAELTPHLLNDIGVSREEALREAAKPFWR
jgi:uncharacterized protein YjiS (DUF1127 family)